MSAPNIPIALVRRVLAARALLAECEAETHATALVADRTDSTVDTINYKAALARQGHAHTSVHEANAKLVEALLALYGLPLDASPDDLEALLAATGRMVARPTPLRLVPPLPDSERVAGRVIDRIVAEIRGER